MTDPVKDTAKLAEEVFGETLGKEWRSQMTVQARIITAKQNIKYLQRYKRLVANGLDNLRSVLKWYHLYQRLRLSIDCYMFKHELSPRVDKLCAEWERVIKFPNNMILGIAQKEQALFEQNYKKSLAIMARMPNSDSMEG